MLLKSVLVETGMPKSYRQTVPFAAGRPLNGPPNGKHINKKLLALATGPFSSYGTRGACSTAVAGGSRFIERGGILLADKALRLFRKGVRGWVIR